MTGHRPHGLSSFRTSDEMMAYGEEFERLIRGGISPETTNIRGGDTIRDCWTNQILSARGVWARLVSLEERHGEGLRSSNIMYAVQHRLLFLAISSLGIHPEVYSKYYFYSPFPPKVPKTHA